MKTDNEESIYQFIKRKAEEYPMLPYEFQNVEVAGIRDTHYILWKDELKASEKEKMVIKLMEVVNECIEKSNDTKLRRVIEEKPLYLYLTKLHSRIS